MPIDYMAQLARIARVIDSVHVQHDAKRGYDILSDALTWSDEYPQTFGGRSEEFDCVRILLRYRTSVLTGDPDELLQPYWKRAKQLFPNWAGFEPSRRVPTDKLLQFYEIRRNRQEQVLKKMLGSEEVDQ